MTPKPASLHVDKPWGSFDQYVLNTPCTVKILTCNPGQKLSLQRHRQRNELWVALDAGVVVELDGQILTPDKGAEIWLPVGSTHRLSCAASAHQPGAGPGDQPGHLRRERHRAPGGRLRAQLRLRKGIKRL